MCFDSFSMLVVSLNQHAVISNHFIATNLLKTAYRWTLTLNINTPVDIIYIDFKKAFESVLHTKQ